MANTSDIREALNIFLQRKASTRLINTLFTIMPTFEFFFALTGQKKGAVGLGRPQTDVLVSSFGTAKAQRAKMMAERIYHPIVQTTKPSTTEVKAMSDYDSDPTVPAWDTTNKPLGRFTQPAFKFAELSMPYKVPHSEIRTAKSSATTEGRAVDAIGSVYDAEVKTREAVLCEKINTQLFGTTAGSGMPTDQTTNQYDSIFSIQAACSDGSNGPGTVYGGVDRSLAQNSWWRGNYVTTAMTLDFDKLIEYCNYDLGFINKGMGVQLLAMGKTLFKACKAQAKAANFQITTGGIREYPDYGFKREVCIIHSGNRPVYCYYEPQMNSLTTSVAALTPDTWTVAFAPDGNFKVRGPYDQRENEGGDRADTGTIDVELMLACEAPDLNAWFSNVA